uniref:Coenzyme F420-dependent N5,N10-methylene tetrahydromethanopterin reductase n=1 Tax=uncultured bacterium esnapd2 TaxID=1366601 RepID=S5UBR6_9BACT|nr:coenzyme F420-dependent N5,N10-methylene tetrahydromethanopterin reductase [uncultured bacterium esnapd2]
MGVVILPEVSWQDHVERWRTVEELGYHSAWTYDHLWWRTNGPWFSAIPVLSAVAASTSRIEIGTMVATPNLRHPAVLAKDAATIQDISGGRFVLGIGAGSPGTTDATVVDATPLSPRTRAERFAEFVELTAELVNNPVTSYSGQFYSVSDALMLPEIPVPLAIAATGPRGMALVARHGSKWITTGPATWTTELPPDEVVAQVAAQNALLDKACAEAGRDSAEIDRILIATPRAGDPLKSAAACREMAERYAETGITHLVVHWPRESGVFAGNPDVLHEIATEVLPRL